MKALLLLIMMTGKLYVQGITKSEMDKKQAFESIHSVDSKPLDPINFSEKLFALYLESKALYLKYKNVFSFKTHGDVSRLTKEWYVFKISLLWRTVNRPQFVIGFINQLETYATQGHFHFLMIIAEIFNAEIHFIDAFGSFEKAPRYRPCYSRLRVIEFIRKLMTKENVDDLCPLFNFSFQQVFDWNRYSKGIYCEYPKYISNCFEFPPFGFFLGRRRYSQ